MDLREGDRVLLRVSGSTLTVEKIEDPIQLAISGRKFASLSPEQAEAISVEEQERRAESSP